MTKETMRQRTEGAWRELCKRQAAVPIEWPFPPARLSDRLTARPALLCPSCSRANNLSRRWCEGCGEVVP